ncbi:15214_t:CDS:2, partial [Gigaspora rosea]
MYICITANGPIENFYKNLRERNSSFDIEAFIRRKENKQDFNNRIFDIEFNRKTTLEQAEKITIYLKIEGTIFQNTATEYYYWRQSWKNEINKFSTIKNIDDITDRVITNIPKSDSGKRIIVSSKNSEYDLQI